MSHTFSKWNLIEDNILYTFALSHKTVVGQTYHLSSYAGQDARFIGLLEKICKSIDFIVWEYFYHIIRWF